MRRKPNPGLRRQELCDAAIQLLAEDGVKGVSHPKVDRKAGVPPGTTSFYFRTRSALLHAVAARVAELELKDLVAAAKPLTACDGHDRQQGPSGLATLVMRSASGARSTRAKARYALELQAGRDPVLDMTFTHNSERFFDLIRDTVLQLQHHDSESDPKLVDAQAYVVMKFIGGVMLALASGERTIRTAEQLDMLMSGIVAGIGATYDTSRVHWTVDYGRRRPPTRVNRTCDTRKSANRT